MIEVPKEFYSSLRDGTCQGMCPTLMWKRIELRENPKTGCSNTKIWREKLNYKSIIDRTEDYAIDYGCSRDSSDWINEKAKVNWKPNEGNQRKSKPTVNRKTRMITVSSLLRCALKSLSNIVTRSICSKKRENWRLSAIIGVNISIKPERNESYNQIRYNR